MPRSKHQRHLAIKEIVDTRAISSQDVLRRELRRRGFSVTQATLSRDFAELGVSRSTGDDGVRYVLQPAAEVQHLQPLISAEVRSIVANETVVVIRTLAGCAQSVAEYLDLQKSPEILGTLAGDNTLLVIPASVHRISRIISHLKETLLQE
jgi:transcriptional regulator of arginine metabolism